MKRATLREQRRHRHKRKLIKLSPMIKQAFDIEVIWGLSWVRGACLVCCRGLTHAGAMEGADRVLR